MHRVAAEGTEFFYFRADEDPREQTELPLGADLPDDRTLAAGQAAADTRFAVFPSMLRPDHGHFYILYWPSGPDLADLDRRVVAHAYDDADFESSVRTVYQDTSCDECDIVLPTLVIPPGDPYPGAPGLLDRKIAASRFQRCGACGSPLRQMVVAILDEP